VRSGEPRYPGLPAGLSPSTISPPLPAARTTTKVGGFSDPHPAPMCRTTAPAHTFGMRETLLPARPRGAFGIDAPAVPWIWVALALGGIVGAIVFAAMTPSWWSILLTCYFAVLAVGGTLGAWVYWHTTLRGKFDVWAALLNGVALRPGDRALDLGCGRGAVAIMTALRFPATAVTGIDLWRSVDQSGNSIDVARRNAELNGVADRVRFDTGDMTELPYDDGSFELITASVSIHNIPTADGRRRALREAGRVLAPGGVIVIADIQRAREYAVELTAAGFDVVGPRPLGWRFWWSGPWMATSLVTARRPDAR
jgi:SAM-dependent methyltransferase